MPIIRSSMFPTISRHSRKAVKTKCRLYPYNLSSVLKAAACFISFPSVLGAYLYILVRSVYGYVCGIYAHVYFSPLYNKVIRPISAA